jgi:hypothetical protein
MRTLQELLEKELRNVPRQILERRLAEKFKAAGLRATKVEINIGDSLIFDDLVTASIVDRLKFEIPREFGKAHDKLRRDDLAGTASHRQ